MVILQGYQFFFGQLKQSVKLTPPRNLVEGCIKFFVFVHIHICYTNVKILFYQHWKFDVAINLSHHLTRCNYQLVTFITKTNKELLLIKLNQIKKILKKISDAMSQMEVHQFFEKNTTILSKFQKYCVTLSMHLTTEQSFLIFQFFTTFYGHMYFCSVFQHQKIQNQDHSFIIFLQKIDQFDNINQKFSKFLLFFNNNIHKIRSIQTFRRSSREKIFCKNQSRV
eukprot:TRINITY_DN289_c2_g1_i10.p1 TRINITY_DN289_c2_g1~~TRINITY_DN289_c2_g1_i10.p1  ORF type:complete len:224 (-),score=-11.69 TRINITY_DN289_c2_g1_i10:895-1566(-)